MLSRLNVCNSIIFVLFLVHYMHFTASTSTETGFNKSLVGVNAEKNA